MPRTVLGRHVGLGGTVVTLSYPVDQLHEEIAYIAYHFHWSLDDILDLEHPTRLRYVEEIAKINRRLSADS